MQLRSRDPTIFCPSIMFSTFARDLIYSKERLLMCFCYHINRKSIKVLTDLWGLRAAALWAARLQRQHAHCMSHSHSGSICHSQTGVQLKLDAGLVSGRKEKCWPPQTNHMIDVCNNQWNNFQWLMHCMCTTANWSLGGECSEQWASTLQRIIQ